MNKAGALMLTTGTQTRVALNDQQVLRSLQDHLFPDLPAYLKLGRNKDGGEEIGVFCFHMGETNPACSPLSL